MAWFLSTHLLYHGGAWCDYVIVIKCLITMGIIRLKELSALEVVELKYMYILLNLSFALQFYPK